MTRFGLAGWIELWRRGRRLFFPDPLIEDWTRLIESESFDAGHYLETHPDVAASGMDPAAHYLTSGASEGRDPNPFFATSFYLENDPEVIAPETNPLLHYLRRGAAEGRDPHPLFDTDRYLRAFPEAAPPAGNPLSHFSALGCDLPPVVSDPMAYFCVLRLHDRAERGRADAQSIVRSLSELADRNGLVARATEAIEDTFEVLLFRHPSQEELLRHLLEILYAIESQDVWEALEAEGRIPQLLGIRPLKLEMDLVNQCNLRCVMCQFSDPMVSRQKKREIPVEDFQRIAEQVFPFCSQVFLSFGTEPLLHRQFPRLLRLTKSFDVPFVAMTTNALLLTDRVIHEMVDSGLDRLHVSVDGATAETYESIRVGGRFERFLDRCRALRRIKEMMGASLPLVAFNFVLMRSNVEELPALVDLADELGIDKVEAIHLVPLANAAVDPHESLHHHQDLWSRVREEAIHRSLERGVRLILPPPFSRPEVGHAPSDECHPSLSVLPLREADRPPCAFPWHFVGVDSSGNVNPCGWWQGQPTFGNILERPFVEIWNDEQYRALRREHEEGTLRPICATCPSVGMGSVNDPRSFTVR